MNLEDDVMVAVEQLQVREKLGFSEAVNRLARAGAAVSAFGPNRKPVVLKTFDVGHMIDVSNVAEALEYLETHDDR